MAQRLVEDMVADVVVFDDVYPADYGGVTDASNQLSTLDVSGASTLIEVMPLDRASVSLGTMSVAAAPTIVDFDSAPRMGDRHGRPSAQESLILYQIRRR